MQKYIGVSYEKEVEILASKAQNRRRISVDEGVIKFDENLGA